MLICIECPVGGLIPWFDKLNTFNQKYIHTYNGVTYVVAEYSGNKSYSNPEDVGALHNDYLSSTMTLSFPDNIQTNTKLNIGVSYKNDGEYVFVVDNQLQVEFSIVGGVSEIPVTFPSQGQHLIYVRAVDNSTELFSDNVTVLKAKESRITLYAFRSRFTIEEKAAIEFSAVDDPLVRAVLKDFDSATYIDLSRLDVQQGIGVFVQKDLLTEPRASEILTPDRATEILSGDVSSSEIPWFFQQ